MHYTPALLPDFRAPRKDPPIRESPSFRSSTTICLRGIGYRSVWNYKYRNNHQYSPCWNTHILGMHALHVASFSGPHPALISTCGTILAVLLQVLYWLVSVPDPKPTPARIAFSIWKQYTRRMRSGDETIYWLAKCSPCALLRMVCFTLKAMRQHTKSDMVDLCSLGR